MEVEESNTEQLDAYKYIGIALKGNGKEVNKKS